VAALIEAVVRHRGACFSTPLHPFFCSRGGKRGTDGGRAALEVHAAVGRPPVMNGRLDGLARVQVPADVVVQEDEPHQTEHHQVNAEHLNLQLS